MKTIRSRWLALLISTLISTTSLAVTFTVTNTLDSGLGSLRAAITLANGTGSGTNLIQFNIPGTNVQTITLASALPAITRPVIIDGYTQPGAHPNINSLANGFSGALQIELNGANTGVVGLRLLNGGSSGSTIRGLVINRCGRGVLISSSSNNVVEGCFIGVNPAGASAQLNDLGIFIEFDGGGNISSFNRIGGTNAAARNVISGNNVGVFVQSGTNNVVQGNLIGTDATGTNGLANSTGVSLAASDTLIGGTNVAARNIIAGPGGFSGIFVGHVTGTRILGNFIGTDSTGSKPLGLTLGIQLDSTASATQIGGPTAMPGTPPGNVVTSSSQGSFAIAVGVSEGGGNGNVIQGNLVCTDATGRNPLGNARFGIAIYGAFNLISSNVISGSVGEAGLFAGGSISLVHDNLIQGNFIGPDITGTNLIGNAGNGIYVLLATSNTIQANVIAGNQGQGVFIDHDTTAQAVLGNSIFANAGLGIFLGSGANNSQTNPVITSAAIGLGNVTLGGSLKSGSNAVYHLEFFSNASCDGSGFGEGQVFLGATNLTTDASGNVSFSMILPNPAGHANFTATATDTNGNTSAFSPCASVSGPCTVICPSNMVVSTAPNQCGAVVNFVPTTTGNCGAVNSTPPSGSFFPKGTNLVTCTSANGTNCSFTIAVFDTVAPTITCPANIVTNVPAAQSSAVVNYSPPVVFDNCGVVSTNCSPASGSLFSLGITTVTCTATDTSGNTNTCSFTVTVTHTNHAPVLTAPADQTIDELTTLSVNVSATDTDAPPNNVTIELVSGPSGLTVSPAGAIGWTPTEAQGPSTNLVVLRAIDDGVPSMSSTQSFTVVVREVNTAPVLTVPGTQFVADGASLNTNVSVSDADVPTNTVTLQLLSFPSGLTMSPAGVVSWSPTLAQRPSTNTVTVRAFDNGSPSLSTTNSFVAIALAPLPPHLTVLNTNDSGSGSLRQAIADVGVSNISLITFASNVTGAITLTSGGLIITNDMSIAGPGAKILAINGNNSNNAALNITKGSANISGLSVTNGGFTILGCVHAAAGATLTLTDCDISHNANNGIINEGTLTAIRCTVSSNNSTTLGVGILNDSGGVAVIRNSTVSGNAGTFGTRGGGIYNRGTLSVSNCSIANNIATFGGGIYIAGGTVTVSSSIIANNDVFGAFVSGGYNLIGRTNGASGFTNGVNHDLAGSTAAPLDPLLGPLQDNGGATLTRALLPGSPAIDNGVASGLVIDQRGVARTIDFPGISNPAGGDGTDIGAFESDEPLLYVARAGNNLEVTWPSNAFHLERTFSLVPPISWQTVSNGLITNAPLLVFPFNVSSGISNQFFRLSLP